MKPIFTLVILFYCFSQSIQAQVCNPAGDAVFERVVQGERRAALGKLMKTASFANDYDIVYHRCDWEVDPAVHWIHGRILTRFKPTVAGFKTVNFDLSDSLSVATVMYHGASIPWTRNNDVLSITLPAVVNPGVLDSIYIDYFGKPVGSGFGSFATSTHDSAAPKPVMWTLSEPYGARDWWPCKQDLNDKIDSIDIRVLVPLGNKVAANGVLVSRDTVGSMVQYHWQSRYPVAAYLVAIAATNYDEFTQNMLLSNNETLPLVNYIYPEKKSVSIPQLEATKEILTLYDSLTKTPYPFYKEKYGHAQFGWGGGMEHQTMSFMGSFVYGLIAHEAAHQWFGDFITCGSWQDIWLNEGFATYFEGLTVARYFPDQWMSWKQAKVTDITKGGWGSVKCYDTSSVNSIFDGRLTYNKGAYLLHMLRWQLGDEDFFKGINTYLADPALQFGYTRTPDLVRHMEAASGQDLTQFFKQWYEGEGYPSYEVIWNQEGSMATIQLNQTTSHFRVPFFTAPVPIQFSNGYDSTTVVLNNTSAGQRFQVQLPFAANSVKVDPELWLITANNTIRNGSYDSMLGNTLMIMLPNPAKDHVTIRFNARAVGKAKDVRILDIAGRELLQQQNSDMQMIMNTSNLISGIYLVRARVGDEYVTGKLVVGE